MFKNGFEICKKYYIYRARLKFSVSRMMKVLGRNVAVELKNYGLERKMF